MNPGLLVRFRPVGPWRFGSDSGARDRLDRIYHSDTLYSAVSNAMERIGRLQAWLEATVGNPAGPAVRFSSCFPCQGEVNFVAPPRSIWPPPPSTRLRSKGARFVPLTLVAALLAEEPLDEDGWSVDGPSECLMPETQSGPFQPAVRSHAAVDRLSGNIQEHSTACLEFAPGAGLWAVAAFAGEQARESWSGPVQTALRLLADSGFGGKRSLGWGRSEMPEFFEGSLPEMILPQPPRATSPVNGEPAPQAESAYWLLSLYSPAAEDGVDWQRGSYSLVTRGGRVESPARWGQPKKLVRMVSEGSVVFAGRTPCGAAPDVAPDGFPHPVFRAGFALSIPIPWRAVS